MNIKISKLRKNSCMWKYLFIILITTISFIVMKKCYPFELAINDDMLMRDIASGAYTGTPDGHLIFIKYALGWSLARLYMMLPQYNWYGFFVFGVFWLCMTVILCRIVQVSKKNAFFSCGIAILFFSMFVIRNLVFAQFTITAVILGSTAVFLLWTTSVMLSRWQDYVERIFIILLLLLCYAVRTRVFQLTLPFIGLILIYRFFIDERKVKEKLMQCGTWVLVLVCLLAIISVIENCAYDSKEWENFSQFNSNRSAIMDYAGYPGYDTHKELYQNNGISKEEYQLLKEHSAMIFSNDSDCSAIANIATVVRREKSEGQFNRTYIEHVLSSVWGKLNSTDYALFNVVFAIVFSCLFMVALYRKNIYSQICLLLMALGDASIWLYLIWEGRLPTRVGITLEFIQLAFLFGMALKIISATTLKSTENYAYKPCRIVAMIVTLFIIYSSCYSLYYEGISLQNENTIRTDITNYCNAHADNFYFTDPTTITPYVSTNGIINTRTAENILPLGSWLTYSPLYYEKLKRNQITGIFESLTQKENIFLLVLEDTEGAMADYEAYFASENMRGESVKVDEIMTTQGRSVAVYQMR